MVCFCHMPSFLPHLRSCHVTGSDSHLVCWCLWWGHLEHFLGSCWGHSQGQCSADLSMAPQGRILRASKNKLVFTVSFLINISGTEIESCWSLLYSIYTNESLILFLNYNMALKLTWRPVDIGATRDFLIGTFALCPALLRHQGAGGRFRA